MAARSTLLRYARLSISDKNFGKPSIYEGFPVFLFNELNNVVGNSAGVSHNGIYRAKDLGTISSLNEYIAFRQAHGIADGTYKDLYLGDYFKIQDGTYNKTWMVAHFDYYHNIGSSTNGGPRGVLLINKSFCTESRMNNSESRTTGGYVASVAHTVTCPAIASALSTVFGSYLSSFNIYASSTVQETIPSNCGLGWNGAVTNCTWTTTQCTIPTENQFTGSSIMSSSAFDAAESYLKLAIFNFISFVEFGRDTAWTRSVASVNHYVGGSNIGYFNGYGAYENRGIKALVYIN